jgi:putative transcriptional regulator
MPRKVKVNVFDDLRTGLKDALAFERGQAVDLRVTEIPEPPKRFKPKEVREIRLSLNASQLIFAKYLGVSANTVRSWEQGTRRPQGADLKLLTIARRNPAALLQT